MPQEQPPTKEKKRQIYENEAQVFITKENTINAEMDYFVVKKDVTKFQMSLINQLFNKIAQLEHYNRAIQNDTFDLADPASIIEQNKRQIEALKERIMIAQERPKDLAEYENRINGTTTSGQDGLSGLTSQGLVLKYSQVIEHLNEEDKKQFGPGKKETHYPHKFDKLSGLTKVAGKERDFDAIQAVKNFGSRVELPGDIKHILEKIEKRN